MIHIMLEPLAVRPRAQSPHHKVKKKPTRCHVPRDARVFPSGGSLFLVTAGGTIPFYEELRDDRRLQAESKQ